MIRILLVDDNPAVRRYLRAILEQQESWRVCGEARTGAEALHQVLEAPPDLILLDYQMPDLNGVDVAKQISELFPKIPILMVTLHLSNQLAEAARNAGVRGACAKQDIGSVVEAVQVLLHNKTYFPVVSARQNAQGDGCAQHRDLSELNTGFPVLDPSNQNVSLSGLWGPPPDFVVFN